MDTATPPQPSTTPPFVFDLDAGVLCLDFVNTLSSGSGEHLNRYADLVDFAHQSALITPNAAARLHARAIAQEVAGAATLERARHLRGALFNIFAAVAADQQPEAADLEVLNGELRASLPHACVEPTQRGFSWGWSGDGLEQLLWPIVRSAADLLTSETQRPLVRECGAGTCRWLFLDTSRNRSRQWCSMQSCGNREKARRHYQRRRAQRTT